MTESYVCDGPERAGQWHSAKDIVLESLKALLPYAEGLAEQDATDERDQLEQDELRALLQDAYAAIAAAEAR